MKPKYMIAVVAAAFFAGCATPPGEEYVIHGAPTYETKSLAMTELVEQLITDPGFSAMYGEAKEIAEKRKQKFPTIAVMPVEDNTRPGANDGAVNGQMFRELQSALRRTGKFRVVDYELIGRISGIDTTEPGIGIRPDNVDNFGNYAPPDFRMMVEVRKADKVYYFLNAQIVGVDGTIAADGSVRYKK